MKLKEGYIYLKKDGGHNMMAGMSSGAFWSIILAISLCMSIALVTVLFLRRRRSRSASKQHASELQLNAGDGQYVVAYTLKPHKQAQPDILNPPPDGSPSAKRAEPVKNGVLHTSDEWADERRVSIADKVSTSSASTVSSKPITVNSTALSRREHLIAEEIPGPESCV